MKTIVHVVWSMEIGGAENIIVDLVNGQSKYENVHLFIINNRESTALTQEISERVGVHRIGREEGSQNPVKILKFNMMLWQLSPDVIHCHNHNLWNVICLFKVLKAKCYLTVHNSHESSVFYSKYDKVFAISQAVKKHIFKQSKVASVVVYNGIPAKGIVLKNECQGDLLRLVQVGRLEHDIKGQDLLLEASAKLIYDYKINNIKVHFVGDGESLKYLKDLACELKIKKYCTFLGVKDREWIYQNLSQYDIFVQPSRSEGFGLAVAEAMVARLPVLISDIDGPMEVINNGEYGSFFESGNSNSLCKQIISIKKRYKTKEFVTMIEHAREYVLEKFVIQQVVKRYLEEY